MTIPSFKSSLSSQKRNRLELYLKLGDEFSNYCSPYYKGMAIFYNKDSDSHYYLRLPSTRSCVQAPIDPTKGKDQLPICDKAWPLLSNTYPNYQWKMINPDEAHTDITKHHKTCRLLTCMNMWFI